MLQVKQYHSLYPKEFINEALKDAPGGVGIFLEGTAPNEVPLIAVGYRYSCKMILYFIQTKNAGSTAEGLPYQMKYTDDYGNVHEHQVERPDVVSKFYAYSNVIDCHNQLRQDLLALEEKWVTHDCYFRLTTTLIGMNVIDTFLLSKYHNIIDYKKKENSGMSVRRFAGALAFQLISRANNLADAARKFKDENDNEPSPPSKTVSVRSNGTLSTVSTSITSTSDILLASNKKVLTVMMDVNGGTHTLVRYDIATNPSGRKRALSRPCKLCSGMCEEQGKQTKRKPLTEIKRRDAGQYCYECGVNMAFCHAPDRNCFQKHISLIKRTTRFS